MARSAKISPVPTTREERIEELMKQLRPKVEEAARQMVERAVDVPEHEEFGAIEYWPGIFVVPFVPAWKRPSSVIDSTASPSMRAKLSILETNSQTV